MGAALIIVQPRLVSMMAPGCHLSPCKVRGFLAGLVTSKLFPETLLCGENLAPFPWIQAADPKSAGWKFFNGIAETTPYSVAA